MLNNIVGLLDAGIPASTNSYESIQTVLVGSGGQSSVSFTSIPSTYKHLQIRGISRDNRSSVNNNVYLQFNGDTTFTNYRFHFVYGDGGGAAAGGDQASGLFAYGGISASANAGSNIFGTSVIDILDYTNTNKNKVTRTLSGLDVNGSGGFISLASGLWLNTNAVTSITLIPWGGNTFQQYSSFALYGIKG